MPTARGERVRREQPVTWLRSCSPSRGTPMARLVFLPPAGGTARTFDPLVTRLPFDVGVFTVQYPGRQDRFGEPVPDRIAEMVDPIVGELAAFTDAPLVMFGHSMGAYVAYEVAVAVERRFGAVVRLLVVSGALAPHRKGLGVTHTLPDAGLAGEVHRVNPDFAELLAQPELMPLLLPVIRADYRLTEQYQRIDPVRVRAPILAVGGRTDPEVDEAGLGEWAACGVGGADVRLLPGGHFYLTEDPGPLAALLSERVHLLRDSPDAGA